MNKANIALLGNPNCGKTSLFNLLTGARQHVGNWPGVTVEKKEGKCIYQKQVLNIVDLPGTYSLGAFSEDEIVARNYILHDKPDLVLNVVDATNLERNLYLTIQAMEINPQVIVVLNMMDEAENKQIAIDKLKLSQTLQVSVVTTVAVKKEGLEKLLANAYEALKDKKEKNFQVDYGQALEREIANLEAVLQTNSNLTEKYPNRWLAIKLLENDDYLLGLVEKEKQGDLIKEQLLISQEKILAATGEEAEEIILDRRYTYTNEVVKKVVTKQKEIKETASDRIDRVVTNKYLGIPIFAAIMYALFQTTFTVSGPLTDWLGEIFTSLGISLTPFLANLGASKLLISFLVDGVIGGLGSVLSFAPPILILFFFMSLLEDSGYMARAAYVMDRLMQTVGLHGKSFISFLMGFGCNVTGIMATRTLDSKKDRMIAILINPFMSCMARLPIYVLFTGVFFVQNQGLIIFSLYLLGILLAIISGKIFAKYLFKGEPSYFIMELPPYRVPTLQGLLIHMWDKAGSFIQKAGTVILAAIILVWVLCNLPAGVEYASAQSYMGKIGTFLQPLLQPIGFGSWQAAAALITGVLAKEAVVGTMAVVYGVGEDTLANILPHYFTPLTACAFMVMSLIYVPCVATIGAIKRETNSWKWTGFAISYSLLLGWLLAAVVYQGGKILGLN